MPSKHTKPTKFQTKLFINNEFVDGVKKSTTEVINPATEEKICDISEATEEDVEKAIDAAEAAFPKWLEVPLKEKSQLLNKLADLIERDLDLLVSLESLDNGKPLELAEGDIKGVIDNIRYYAGWADKVTGKTFAGEKDKLYYTRREPFGVVGLISPWNYPLLMGEWKFAPAIAAGNCVVHKPSSTTPLSFLKVCELFKEAGFPPGVYNCVPGSGSVAGGAICKSKRVGKVSFTGSTKVGRKVMEMSSQSNLKKCTLELGGKSPVIICPDADLDKAAEIAWEACMSNMGQCCIAGTRLFVHESVYDDICKRLKKFESKVKIGDAFDGANHGPQVSEDQMNKILGYFDQAKKENLECLMGGERAGTKGYFIKPTIYINVDDKSQLVQEEIFGPVLCVLKPWKKIDEVIKRANDTDYGLAGVVISKDMNLTEKIVRQVKAGTMFVNCFNNPEPYMPFGGYKQSGFGRDNGEEALIEYTQIKSVYYQLEEPTI